MQDLITRQAAIEVIDAAFPVNPTKSEYAQGLACGVALAKTYVEQLPSVQPEIIRCKDCKYSSPNTVYGCRLERFSYLDDGVRMYSDDYCSRGDKK